MSVEVESQYAPPVKRGIRKSAIGEILDLAGFDNRTIDTIPQVQAYIQSLIRRYANCCGQIKSTSDTATILPKDMKLAYNAMMNSSANTRLALYSNGFVDPYMEKINSKLEPTIKKPDPANKKKRKTKKVDEKEKEEEEEEEEETEKKTKSKKKKSKEESEDEEEEEEEKSKKIPAKKTNVKSGKKKKAKKDESEEEESE